MNLKHCFLSLILGILLLGSLAATVVQGVVRDESGALLEGVSVYDGSGLAITGASGHFSIRSFSDSLSFARLGFEPLSLPLAELPDEIVMKRVELRMPVVRVIDRGIPSALPAINTSLIYPDTNAGSSSAADLLLEDSAFLSTDIALTGEYQSLSLLGSHSRHTLVMIDGVAVNSPGEAFDLSRIPASQISHIEVIKGSSSVYGGSSAIGGIVNIITKNPTDHLLLELEGGLGSFDMYSQRYLASLALEHFSLNAQYSHYQAQNDFEYQHSMLPDSSFCRINNRKTADYFFFKGAYGGENSFYQAVLNYDSYVRELPGSISFPQLFDGAVQTGMNSLARFSMTHKRENLGNDLILGWDQKAKTYNNLHSSISVARAHERQKYLSLLLQNRIFWANEDWELKLSGELKPIYYESLDLLQDEEGGYTRYLNGAVSARTERKWQGNLLGMNSAVALRGDFTEHEDALSWRMEQRFVLYLPVELGLKANLGTAFSSPSLFDLHYIGDSYAGGGSGLKSESASSWDLGIYGTHRFFHSEASYYKSEVDDLIQWRQTYENGPRWRPFNVGRVEIENWELNLKLFPLKYLSLEAGLNLTEARDRSRTETGEPSATYGKYLPYTPDMKAKLALGYEMPIGGIKLSYSKVGEQYDTLDGLAGSLPAYDNLNLQGYLAGEIKELGCRLDLELNNLQDRRYEIYAHTPQPGFNWNLSLKLSYRI